ncbi:MAG: hypothetical protein A4S08_06045 [Proteobacteria bacterium SG_bin4]|nr:MAG: hypothetical protein A4S08_06045 [Proteobacteria bacterium SG_bin4]
MVQDKEYGFGFIPICGCTCRKLTIKLLWLFFALYLIYQYYAFRFSFGQWDLLLLSGVVAFIIGLYLVAGIPDKIEKALSRLIDRKILIFKNQLTREDFFKQLHKKAEIWARFLGFVACLFMAFAFIISLEESFKWPRVFLGIAETLGAYIGGSYIGQMVCYGLLGGLHVNGSVKINIDPFHLDGVGGLKPLGDYLFHQAMIVAIPAIFLAIWWFLFPFWPRDYHHWGDSYLFLLAGALLIEILSFVIPMLIYHNVMLDQKNKWIKEADAMSNHIRDLQQQLNAEENEEKKKIQLAQIEEMTKRYWAIENLTTWPIDVKTRRKFELNNLLLFIPLVGDLAKNNFNLQHALELIKGLAQ